MGLLMVPQHAMHCIAGTRIVLNVRSTAATDHSLTTELNDLETFDAMKFARSRGDKSQHSMLDIAADAKESTLGSTLGRNSDPEEKM